MTLSELLGDDPFPMDIDERVIRELARSVWSKRQSEIIKEHRSANNQISPQSKYGKTQGDK